MVKYCCTHVQLQYHYSYLKPLRKEAEECASEVRMMENALMSAKTNLVVTRRAADKASVDVTKAEEQKVQQDLYVDWLTDKVCIVFAAIVRARHNTLL